MYTNICGANVCTRICEEILFYVNLAGVYKYSSDVTSAY